MFHCTLPQASSPKNHLAKEGPGCVAPVIIPALAPTLDKSLKEDRTLCPVRSLRYYLDKTKDLGQTRSWFSSPLGKASRRTLYQQLSLHGSNKRLAYDTNSQMSRLKICIKFGPMMSAPSRLLSPFKEAYL